MEQQLEQIREQQKATWNKFSSGWKKWDQLTMAFLKPMGTAIIDFLQPENNHQVLDIAAGTGEPGLTIASLIPNGKVTVTDLSEEMLAIAREHAEKRGLKNVETKTADVCDLPFANNSFDLVSCRFGFMFFPDMDLAAQEIYRVLKHNGKLATSVWSGPEGNFWVTAIMDAIKKHVTIEPPPPGAPGIFRCAEDGLLQGILKQAGFKNIRQKQVRAHLNAGTVDTYWQMMTEVAAPVVAAMSKADESTKEKIKKDVFQSVANRYPTGEVSIEATSLVLYGEK